MTGLSALLGFTHHCLENLLMDQAFWLLEPGRGPGDGGPGPGGCGRCPLRLAYEASLSRKVSDMASAAPHWSRRAWGPNSRRALEEQTLRGHWAGKAPKK